MASSPSGTDAVRFLTANGGAISAPCEWTPALIEIPGVANCWEQVRLLRNGVALPVMLRQVQGIPAAVADWPRSGPGRYHLRLTTGDHTTSVTVTVPSSKLTPDGFTALLLDLDHRLPHALTLALQRGGGLAGLAVLPPQPLSLAGELERLRQAVQGTEYRPGLRDILPEIARAPHHILTENLFPARWELLRRPHPAHLARERARMPAGMALETARFTDRRVEPAVDVPENRLVLTYTLLVERRLRRLCAIAMAGAASAATAAELANLAGELVVARRSARFLDEVTPLTRPPAQFSMVLLHRPLYRATLDGYLDLLAGIRVELDDSALEAPLENLPALYQLWGTLQVVSAITELAAATGYQVATQHLVSRTHDRLFVRKPAAGQVMVTLCRADGRRVEISSERTFGVNSAPRSVSYPQRPDIAVWFVSQAGTPLLFLFDPKYKLSSDDTGIGTGGQPLKEDIDKMHAYRDAIRSAGGEHIVRHAAILHPGSGAGPFGEVEAISARPNEPEPLRERLRELLGGPLTGAPPPVHWGVGHG